MSNSTVQDDFELAYVTEMIRICGKSIRAAAKSNLAHKRPDGSYEDPLLRMSIWAWQASREALVIELPQIVAYEAGYDSIRENEFASDSGELFDADEVFALHRSIEVLEAIEAAGLKVKP